MPTVAEIITENVIKQLEQGVAPWRKPWSTSVPRNLISTRPYRGLNVFLLATQGYGSPYWLTFNQAKQLGAHVCKGEKSTLVSFWKFNEYARENRDTGETENKTSVSQANPTASRMRIHRQSNAKCTANRSTTLPF